MRAPAVPRRMNTARAASRMRVSVSPSLAEGRTRRTRTIFLRLPPFLFIQFNRSVKRKMGSPRARGKGTSAAVPGLVQRRLDLYVHCLERPGHGTADLGFLNKPVERALVDLRNLHLHVERDSRDRVSVADLLYRAAGIRFDGCGRRAVLLERLAQRHCETRRFRRSEQLFGL